VYINKFGHIFIPRINSHHIHLDLNKYLPQIIDSINTDKCDDLIEMEYEFPNYIGETQCIPTSSDSDIIYCIRKGRTGHSRFILNTKPIPCKHISAVFKKVEGAY